MSPSQPSPCQTHHSTEPSAWIRRFASLVPPRGAVLDVACGSGRHLRFFRDRDHPVVGVDIDLSRVADLANDSEVELLAADLEGGPWPLGGRHFAAVIVTNYLWRPLFPHLLAALAPDGVLLYETFAQGNARFGRPANPDHLLAPGELLDRIQHQLHIVAFEHGIVTTPRLAAVQRICAVNLPSDPDHLMRLPPVN